MLGVGLLLLLLLLLAGGGSHSGGGFGCSRPLFAVHFKAFYVGFKQFCQYGIKKTLQT